MRVLVVVASMLVLSPACSEDPSGETVAPTNPDPRPNGIAAGSGGGAGAAATSGAPAGGSAGSGAGATGAAGRSPVGPGGAGSLGAGSGGTTVVPGSSGAGASAAAGSGGASGAAGATAGSGGAGGRGGSAASSGTAGRGGPAAGRSGSAAGSGGSSGAAPTPVLQVALRVHTGDSRLTEAQLTPILAEVNEIWLKQAGICFEVEVTDAEQNIANGIDLRYTAGDIPGAAGANGLASGQHEVWVIDSPSLGAAPNPVRSPAARTSAHELGHVLNLAHQNPPPSTDCARPCHCAVMNANCDDFLMRSGRAGVFLSADEIAIARRRAMQLAIADTGPTSCSAPRFMP